MLWQVALCYLVLPFVFLGLVFMLVCLWALAKKPTDAQIDEDLRADYDDLRLHWTDTD
jgi:hypothetical protein